MPSTGFTGLTRRHRQSQPVNLSIRSRASTGRIDGARHGARTRAIITLDSSIRRGRPLFLLLPDPRIPQNPSHGRPNTSPADNRDRTDAVLDNTHEAADENSNRTDMLHNNRRVRNKRPKVIRPHAGIPLKMIKKCLCIGIVIRIYRPSVKTLPHPALVPSTRTRLFHPKQLLPSPLPSPPSTRPSHLPRILMSMASI